MTNDERGDERLRIIWSEALRMIERQAAAVDELRSRAALLLTAGAVVAGFMGSSVADRGLGVLGLVALVALAMLAALAVFTLYPRKWSFVLSPNVLLDKHFKLPGLGGPNRLLVSLIKQTEDYYDENEPKRKRMARGIALCCFLLALEVVTLLVRLATL